MSHVHMKVHTQPQSLAHLSPSPGYPFPPPLPPLPLPVFRRYTFGAKDALLDFRAIHGLEDGSHIMVDIDGTGAERG